MTCGPAEIGCGHGSVVFVRFDVGHQQRRQSGPQIPQGVKPAFGMQGAVLRSLTRVSGDLLLQSTCSSSLVSGWTRHICGSPDHAARRYQRYRRIWTFCTRPINANNVTRPEPPYETNGSGKPVTGISPRFIPTVWNTCHSTIVNTPAQM